MRGPAGLHVVASGSIAVLDKNLFNRKWDFIAHSLSVSLPSPLYDRNTVEKDVKLQVIHPSILNLLSANKWSL